MDYVSKKVVFFGDPCSGKTYLLVSILNDDPKDMSIYTTEANGKQVRLILCDTNSDYDRLFHLYFSGCDLVILCFSVDDPNSLKNIEEFWIQKIRQNDAKVPLLLVANKCDLRADPATILKLSNIGDRIVSLEDGRNMATKIGACAYFECSAVTKLHIQELVRMMAEITTVDYKSQLNKETKGACRIC